VRWPPAYENMSLKGEECPLLEDVTKQRSEDFTVLVLLSHYVRCLVLDALYLFLTNWQLFSYWTLFFDLHT
jgi:hypothetical protein